MNVPARQGHRASEGRTHRGAAPLPELRFESAAGGGRVSRGSPSFQRARGPAGAVDRQRIQFTCKPGRVGSPAPSAFPPATDDGRIQGGPWHVEKDDDSIATAHRQTARRVPVEFGYRLAGGGRTGQYAALGISVGNALSNRLASYSGRAPLSPCECPCRPGDPHSGDRWQRSIYLDRQPRDIVIPFADMRPVGTSRAFDPASSGHGAVRRRHDECAAQLERNGHAGSDLRVER